MAASLKDKRTPITTPPYQVPSVDVTQDPPIFLLVTTFKNNIKVMKSCCIILYEAYLDEICHIYNFSTAINFKAIFIKKN
jgi:hypothetical protein